MCFIFFFRYQVSPVKCFEMTDLCDDEDTVEFPKKSVRQRRQRAAIYIPGLSEEGSCIEISQSNTPDGPLLLGQEVPRRKKMNGGRNMSLWKTYEDIDSGVESSFSLLSLADDSVLHQSEKKRPSIGLNTAHIPMFELPDGLTEECARAEYESNNNAGETASFLQEAEELLEYSDLSTKSDSIESVSGDFAVNSCCHGDDSVACTMCCEDINVKWQKSRALNLGLQPSEIVATEESSYADGKILDVVSKGPVKKEILSLPVDFPTSSPVPRGNVHKSVKVDEKKAFEQSFVPVSELLFMKRPVPFFTTYKSPSKYSPQRLLSPSRPEPIRLAGEERQSIGTQTGQKEHYAEGGPQYLPALDGRMPGSPPKDKVVRTMYLSPISMDSRTTSEIWEDVVHNSDLKFRDMPLCRGVYTDGSAQTETSESLSSRPAESVTKTSAVHENDNQQTATFSKPPMKRNEKDLSVDSNSENVAPVKQCASHHSSTLRKTFVSHRRLFSELPVSPSNCQTRQNNPFSGPMTPVQDKKRLKPHDLYNGSGDASLQKGRAIRKNGLKDSSQSKNGGFSPLI